MVRILYNFLIRLFQPILFFGGWFSQKLLKMRVGQSQTLNLISTWKLDRPIWIHAASLGEFEMALPLIETLHLKQPNTPFLISFFSPSGYKNAKLPDYCKKVYLLPDTSTRSKQFIQALKPQIAIFVKYEIWLNHLDCCHDLDIPVYYWNLILRNDHFIFSSWAMPWLNTISKCKKLFCQDKNTIDLLSDFNIKQSVLTGDIRFNRALEIQEHGLPEDLFEHSNGSLIHWLQTGNILILGSSWPTEEQMLFEALSSFKSNPLKNDTHTQNKSFKIVIVPHDISEEHIQQIQRLFSGYMVNRFSENHHPDTQILIIDTIGLLSRLYRFAHIAFIGGGFSGQLHNIIEAAAAGCITLYGPNAKKFPESDQFADWRIGFKIKDSYELVSHLQEFWISLKDETSTDKTISAPIKKEQIIKQISTQTADMDSVVNLILN